MQIRDANDADLPQNVEIANALSATTRDRVDRVLAPAPAEGRRHIPVHAA